MKKTITIAITALLLCGFSSSAWCSLVGNWDVDSLMRVKVKIEGERPVKEKVYIWESFNFYPNGTFESLDMSGSWAEIKKGKFIVTVDTWALETLAEQMLFDALGINIYVNVEHAYFVGKYKDGKKGERTKGKFILIMNFYDLVFGINGTVKAKGKFIGTRPLYGGLQAPADTEDASPFGDILLEAVKESLYEAGMAE